MLHAEKILQVATRNTPPFSYKDSEGQWAGLSIDLWEACAKEMNVEFQYTECSLDELLTKTSKREFDLGVAGISLTPERETRLDFTHAFLNSQLAIGSKQSKRNPILAVVGSIFSIHFLQALLPLATLLLIVGTLLWYFEHKKNNEEFAKSPTQGIIDGFWFSAVTMTTVGYGDKSPKSLGGKTIALFWMFASVIIISGFTAGIASSLTAGYYQSRISSLADLQNKDIGCVSNSTAAQLLADTGIDSRYFKTPSEAYLALTENKLDAVILDEPTLRFLSQSQQNDISIIPIQSRPQQYGFVMPPGSALREKLNQSLLKTINSQEWKTIKQHYLGN